jgi:two-component system nitrate/nitrite response regulator NarL
MDPMMLGISGPDILAIASSCNLPTRMVFFVSPMEDRNVATLAAAGASGVISRNAEPETLVRTLRLIAGGERLFAVGSTDWEPTCERPEIVEEALSALTEREHQIMDLVSQGLSNKEIGRRLRIADGTIKVHLHHIFKKLEISNRTVLAALAVSQSRAH